METAAEELAEEYNLTLHQAKRVLATYQYSVKRASNPLKYELESTLRKAGLSLEMMEEDESDLGASKTIECDICWNDFPPSEMDMLGCEHKYCIKCWKRHVTESVAAIGKSGKASGLDRRCVLHLTCPHGKCDRPVPLDKLEHYGGDEFVKKRNIWYAEDITLKVPKYKQCPDTDCNNIIEFEFSEDQIEEMPQETGELECKCGHWFCWFCKREAHSPCSCQEVNDWRSLSSEDAAVERLKSKCKQCPGCGAGCYINDKTACNHMICPCGHEWCWMCSGPWAEHGNSYYNCSKYQAAAATSAMKQGNMKRDKKLADIQRLDKYEERVSRMAAGSTGKGAAIFRDKVQDMKEKLQSMCGYTERELQFLWDAFRTVINMKRMLKWSWVFLFFRPEDDGDSERQLFDNQRGQLEFMCDALHEKIVPTKEDEILGFEGFLTPASGSRNGFFKWKAAIISLMTQIAKFGEGITSAAMKGTTITDQAERVKVQRRLAKQRMKLIDWQWYDGTTWHMHPLPAAETLELSKLMRQKTCTICIERIAYDVDLLKNEQVARKRAAPKQRIRRQVKAKLALNVWKCPKCSYQTPKDLNCCSGCGTVRGH